MYPRNSAASASDMSGRLAGLFVGSIVLPSRRRHWASSLHSHTTDQCVKKAVPRKSMVLCGLGVLRREGTKQDGHSLGVTPQDWEFYGAAEFDCLLAALPVRESFEVISVRVPQVAIQSAVHRPVPLWTDLV